MIFQLLKRWCILFIIVTITIAMDKGHQPEASATTNKILQYGVAIFDSIGNHTETTKNFLDIKNVILKNDEIQAFQNAPGIKTILHSCIELIEDRKMRLISSIIADIDDLFGTDLLDYCVNVFNPFTSECDDFVISIIIQYYSLHNSLKSISNMVKPQNPSNSKERINFFQTLAEYYDSIVRIV